MYTFIHTEHIRNIATSILFTAHFLLPKSPPSLRSCELWHFLRLRSGWFGSLGAELFADAALWHCGDGAETPLQQFQARRLAIGQGMGWWEERTQLLEVCVYLSFDGVSTNSEVLYSTLLLWSSNITWGTLAKITEIGPARDAELIRLD